MNAPVTAPVTSLHERRREAAARIFREINRTVGTAFEPTDADYHQADALLAQIEKGEAAPLTVMVEYAGHDHSARVATALAEARAEFISDAVLAHDYDLLLFGGAYCVTCTPDGDCNSEDLVIWPCPPLTAAGFTVEMAAEVVKATDNEVARRVAEAQEAGAAEFPELHGFEEHHGVRVSYVGEDESNLFALGWHVNAEQVLAAFDAYARKVAGINGVWDSDTEKPQPRDLVRAWCVNTGKDGVEWCLMTKDYSGDGEPREYTHADPGAFPVTILWER
jgi:hypothetical protein